MSAAGHLRVVDPETGEVHERCPGCAQLEDVLAQRERHIRGQDLRIAALERDRDRWAAEHPLRPEVEAVAACWRKATAKRRGVDPTDVEQIARVLQRKGGFLLALRAVRGAGYDPHVSTRRNGTRTFHNDLELVFRNAGKVQDFADRAPAGWEPDAERVAEIAGVETAWVAERLDPAWRGRVT